MPSTLPANRYRRSGHCASIAPPPHARAQWDHEHDRTGSAGRDCTGGCGRSHENPPRSPVADRRGVHDHLHRSGGDLGRGAFDPSASSASRWSPSAGFSVLISVAYALFQIPGGWLGDRFGPRRALSAIVVWWSAFTALTARDMVGDVDDRVSLPVRHGGGGRISNRNPLAVALDAAFRARIRARHHACGLAARRCTDTSRRGVPDRTLRWRAPFYVFAVLGLIWAVVWFAFYRDSPSEHRMVNAAERELIAASPRQYGRHSRRTMCPGDRFCAVRRCGCCRRCTSATATTSASFSPGSRSICTTSDSSICSRWALYASLPLLAGVAGDICGGWFSDLALKRSGDLKFARRVVAIAGFLIAALTIPLACLADRSTRQRRLLLHRGVQHRADRRRLMGGDVGYRRRVCGLGFSRDEYLRQSRRRNRCGHDRVHRDASGWNTAFFVLAGYSLVAAILFTRIDASKRVYERVLLLT